MTTDSDAKGVALGPDQAGFITGPVSINVASCDLNLVPSVTRAFGCRASVDRREITVFLSTPRSADVLRDIRAGAMVAVVFSRPSTHRTLQLKGRDARIMPLARGDRALMIAYGAAFSTEIRDLGYPELFAGGLASGVDDDAVALVFTPCAAFEQTPGPLAGQALVAGR
ncbi:MAG: hypothetical protein R3E46_18755 [Sedimenticolaceae bacterium]